MPAIFLPAIQEETADVQQTGEEVVPPIDKHVSEFRNSSDNFVVGKISTHIHNWRSITSDEKILKYVKEY